MYRSVFPQYDSTIYEKYPKRNTGIDQILEITKFAIGSKADDGVAWAHTYNSRILIKFNLTDISQSIVTGKITGNPKYYLKLYSANSSDLPVDYTIYAYPISGSWTNGNGNLNDEPEIREGVTWESRTGLPQSLPWNSGSGVELAYQSVRGGGSYYTSSLYIASQSFAYTSPDLYIDVTNMVNGWLNNAIPNNGLILKRSNLDESGSSILGSISFFSKDTHTIYLPRLDVFWDDSVTSGTGSYTEVGETYSLALNNIKPQYKKESKARIRLKCRDKYPVKTYSTSSNYLNYKRLPTSSYYSVIDYATGDTIIPFNDLGTKISCDSQGNYLDLDMSAFFTERYYQLLIKVVRNGGDLVDISDDYYLFRVVR